MLAGQQRRESDLKAMQTHTTSLVEGWGRVSPSTRIQSREESGWNNIDGVLNTTTLRKDWGKVYTTSVYPILSHPISTSIMHNNLGRCFLENEQEHPHCINPAAAQNSFWNNTLSLEEGSSNLYFCPPVVSELVSPYLVCDRVVSWHRRQERWYTIEAVEVRGREENSKNEDEEC